MTDDVIEVRRLRAGDEEAARRTIRLISDVFEDGSASADEGHVERLLADPQVWIYGAFEEGEPLGGLTAHLLPLTRSSAPEVFVYDVAVRDDRQGAGIGTRLVEAVRADAAHIDASSVWVIAEVEDAGAVRFYRRSGGEEVGTVMFTWPGTTS